MASNSCSFPVLPLRWGSRPLPGSDATGPIFVLTHVVALAIVLIACLFVQHFHFDFCVYRFRFGYVSVS